MKYTFQTRYFNSEWKTSRRRYATIKEAADGAAEWMVIMFENDTVAEVKLHTVKEEKVLPDLTAFNEVNPRWFCGECGYTSKDIPLPKDRTAYYANPKPKKCPKCKSDSMDPMGF